MYTHFHTGWIYAVHESAPTEHALSQGYTGLSQDVRQNTLGQTFWQSGTRHRGAYQNDELTTRPAALMMKTPETRNRIYWGSHMQHIYRESTVGAIGTFIAGGLTEQETQKRHKTRQKQDAQTPKPRTGPLPRSQREERGL